VSQHCYLQQHFFFVVAVVDEIM
jgi:hypothetical protein